MRRALAVLMGCVALVAASALPGVAAMGQGPGHDLANMVGANILAQASTAEYTLAFTGHTNKNGAAHGSVDFVTDGVAITDLDLRRLAFMDEETAASGGCTHGAMVIARGTALFNGTEQVRVWIDLQERDAGDRARIRAMAVKDHDDHDDHADSPDSHTDGPSDGHTDGHTDGHDGCSDGGSPWLYRSHWFAVRDVAVHFKGYATR
jgi:hypothetical protein